MILTNSQHDPNVVTKLTARLTAAEQALVARDKTIQALIRRERDRAARRDSPLAALEENAVLQAVVKRKTQELTLAHAESRFREQRFRQLSAAAPIGIFETNADGKILYTNQCWQEITGLPEEQNLGDGWRRAVHHEDEAWVAVAWAECMRLGQEFRREFRFQRLNGEARWVSVRSTVLRSDLGVASGQVGTAEDITERRQSEELLRLQEAAIRSTANVVVITNRQGNIVWTNPAFTQITGYTAEEAHGKNPRILKHTARGTPDPYPAHYYQELWQTISHGRVWQGTFHNCRKDGSDLIEEATITPVRNEAGEITHFVAVKQDITTRKHAEVALARAQQELRKSEEQFRLITENVADLIAIVDRQGHRLYNSPSYERLLGFTRDELTDSLAFAQIHPEDRDRVIAAARQINEVGLGQVLEYRMQHKDGTWRTLESHGAPFRNTNGEIEGVLTVARDVTERKQADQERHAMEVQLRQAQKLESIGRLAAGIAHEINTPTQYIGDNARFMRDAFTDLVPVLETPRQLLAAARENRITPELLKSVDDLLQKADLDYILAEVPKAIDQSLQGVDRVAKIVRAMKEFSHPGQHGKNPGRPEPLYRKHRHRLPQRMEIRRRNGDALRPGSSAGDLSARRVQPGYPESHRQCRPRHRRHAPRRERPEGNHHRYHQTRPWLGGNPPPRHRHRNSRIRPRKNF